MSDDTIVFVYNKKITYLQNYREWKNLNDLERDAWRLEHLTAEEAEDIFSKLYGDYK